MFDGINGWWWLIIVGAIFFGRYLFDQLLAEVSVRYFRIDKAADWILKDGWNWLKGVSRGIKRFGARIKRAWNYIDDSRLSVSSFFTWPISIIGQGFFIKSIILLWNGFWGSGLFHMLIALLGITFPAIVAGLLLKLFPLRVTRVPSDLRTEKNAEIWEKIENDCFSEIKELTFLPDEIVLKLLDSYQNDELDLSKVRAITKIQANRLIKIPLKRLSVRSKWKYFHEIGKNAVLRDLLNGSILSVEVILDNNKKALVFSQLKVFRGCDCGCYPREFKWIADNLSKYNYDRIIFVDCEQLDETFFQLIDVLNFKEIFLPDLKELEYDDAVNLVNLESVVILGPDVKMEKNTFELCEHFRENLIIIEKFNDNWFKPVHKLRRKYELTLEMTMRRCLTLIRK